MSALNKRLIIERPVKTRDAAGQPIAGWGLVGERWGGILYLNGLEAIKSGAEVSIKRASLRLRYCTDVDETMRVRYGSVIFAIKAVLPDEGARQHTDLACEVVK